MEKIFQILAVFALVMFLITWFIRRRAAEKLWPNVLPGAVEKDSCSGPFGPAAYSYYLIRLKAL